jgi:hypothetical protein
LAKRIAILLVALLAMAVAFWWAGQPRPETEAHQSVIEKEFQKVTPPSEAVLGPLYAKHRNIHALVSQEFKSKWSYEKVRDYYAQALRTLGWRFVREEPVREWGRDLGGKIQRYCKGSYEATLQYGGAKTESGLDYDFSMSWNVDRDLCVL